MFNKGAGGFYRGIKPWGETKWFYIQSNLNREFIERLQKHPGKACLNVFYNNEAFVNDGN